MNPRPRPPSSPISVMSKPEIDTLIMKMVKYKKITFRPTSKESKIALENDIAEHAKYAYHAFYKHAYHTHQYEEIPRPIHGIQHVGRVAAYIPILANLYRAYGSSEAKTLSEEDLKLLQIAALLHDSAREGEGVDKWDEDSAIFLYAYLTQTLQVPVEKAKLMAEAVANKDTGPPENKRYRSFDPTTLTFSDNLTIKERNIYQKLIHDADSLDIQRVRGHYVSNYLDFYIDVAKHNINDASYVMAELIKEIQSLIKYQGDGYRKFNYKTKKSYEDPNGYKAIVDSITSEDKKSDRMRGGYPILKAFFNEGNLTDTSDLLAPLKVIGKIVPQATMQEISKKNNINIGLGLTQTIGIVILLVILFAFPPAGLIATGAFGLGALIAFGIGAALAGIGTLALIKNNLKDWHGSSFLAFIPLLNIVKGLTTKNEINSNLDKIPRIPSSPTVKSASATSSNGEGKKISSSGSGLSTVAGSSLSPPAARPLSVAETNMFAASNNKSTAGRSIFQVQPSSRHQSINEQKLITEACEPLNQEKSSGSNCAIM